VKLEMKESSVSASLCLLAFGDPGEIGVLSLSSIFKNVQVSRFCICADSEGQDWILRNTPKEKLESLCFHRPEESALDGLNLDLSQRGKYSEFGKDRFIKLTTFKWQLMRDSMKAHPDSRALLFSDLDVIWFSDPFSQDQLTPISKIFAQDDTPKYSKSIHLCSGIMFFPQDSETIEILDALFKRQLDSNMKGLLIPDEPILNQWFRETRKVSLPLLALDSRRFVIGHRFLHSLLWRSSRREQMVCFHVNYVVGENRKAILGRLQGDWRWPGLAFIEFVLIIVSKVPN
jgi:hypothetical protein